ncbi:MAG: ABC transporter permease [Candidatus Humimicrobiaceae bacterium]
MDKSEDIVSDRTKDTGFKYRIKRFFGIESIGIYLFLVAIIIFFSLRTSAFLTFDNFIVILRQVSIIGICAFGEAFIVISGGIDLSVGSVVALSGVISAALSKFFGIPLPVAFFAGITTGGFCGFLNGTLATRVKIPPIIVTLGTLTIIRGVAFIVVGGNTIFGMPEKFRDLGRGYIGFIPVPVLIMIIIFIIFFVVLNNLSFGRHIYAIGSNEEAAIISGINVNRIKTLVFTIGGLTAGLGGAILASRLDSGQASTAQGLEIDVLTAVVLGGVSIAGGKGKLETVFVGVLIIGILANGLVLLNVQHFYQLVIKGSVLLLAVSLDVMRKK